LDNLVHLEDLLALLQELKDVVLCKVVALVLALV
jgi:hypothetical protein